METNLSSCTRTGRTISEKTMEDGNVVNTKDDKITSAALANLYSERPAKLGANGHEFAGEPSSLPDETYDHRPASDTSDDKCRKRINPLRIHLGKRPFVDNSLQYYSSSKKRKPYVIKPSDNSTPSNTVPRAPKLIPKRQFHNVTSQSDTSIIKDEQDKPVPRLVPKSQLMQYKKGKVEKGSQLKEYAQSLGLQPMVKFKCRKCCSMSFKTLAMLKEHQLVCRAQAKEPALSPEAAPSADTNSGGPSRVTRKVYLCSACGTYYENWNLFLHMREVHNRHICLFCLGMFSKAEKLSSHLTNKHNVKEFNYDSKEDFFNVYNGTLYLMCCACDEICSEQDDFFNHDCNNVKPKPVPVLISKNAIKPNTVKINKNCNELSTNGPTTIVKELNKAISDKKEISDVKPEAFTLLAQKSTVDTNISEPVNSDTSISSEISASTNKDTSNTVDSGMELESSDTKPISSPIQHTTFSPQSTKQTFSPQSTEQSFRPQSTKQTLSPQSTKHLVSNGDDSVEQSDESDSSVAEDIPTLVNEFPTQPEEPLCPPPEREKQCGIKLKLSLNNANSPVIIKSTVDPTVGQQKLKVNKPPSRVRRPPKRYEKETTDEQMIQLQKTPSIKMTICDRADSPFVKTTIYENHKETTLKTVLNNNLETASTTIESKSENTVKTTIYDNKLEDVNTLNRVPKLTVRVPKELLDKDSSSDYSSDSDVSDKLTVDENNTTVEDHNKLPEEPIIEPQPAELPAEKSEEGLLIKEGTTPLIDENDEIDIDVDEPVEPKTELKTEPIDEEKPVVPKIEEPEIPVTELSLDRPLDKYPLKDLLKVFLASTVYGCIYCNHVRKIAVNCEQLSLHMVAQHRFSATVDSITAEELLPETITAKLKTDAEEFNSVFINLDSYDSAEKCAIVQYDHTFECFQCYFKTAVHKDLYLHNRKMHQKTILLCIMCKSNFYSYSELLCHLCPGTYDSEYEVKFRCCLCNVDSIPSPFRLMVHLRKIHHTCDVCLEFCHNQARLSNHVWKHKLHHLCFRCGIAYRNKPDITNHLFWKHGTESVLCKRCLTKKWPHVYHFCSPPAVFVCEECNLQFTKAVYLKVHKRFHSGEFPHECTEDGCTEKFVSKKLLDKHIKDHKSKLTEDVNDVKPSIKNELSETPIEPVPVIDLVNDKPLEEAGPSEIKDEVGTEQISKKAKKKKSKDKDALLLDVNLPALNLSESDSSDESDSGLPPPTKEENQEEKIKEEEQAVADTVQKSDSNVDEQSSIAVIEEKKELLEEDKSSEQQVLDIWDNFKKYQAKVEKQKEKSPPLVPIRKHVCESDHDYCIIPTDMNGDEDMFSLDKKKNKKTPKKQRGDLSSSSSSSSDSDSSCSCGSNCSCSSSSGSSSSSSSDSDSSEESGNEKKKKKRVKRLLPNRRISNGSNVDVMGMSETPILIPEKVEPPIAETDLETDESETDEEFYDEHPQRIANKLYEEKRNQLLLLASVAPSDADGGSMSGEISRPCTPIKEEKEPKEEIEVKIKPSSSKKKSKKKKKSKSSKKHGPIKINIPKEVIANSEVEAHQPLLPNKITISLQSNTVQIPNMDTPKSSIVSTNTGTSTPTSSADNKRASKRRRVPNKFYGYSSDDESSQTATPALKPQQPPKLEWRKEDLPSPVTHKAKKEVPSTVMTNRLFNYSDPIIGPIRLTAPIPDPEPPRILMNTESMESSDSDSSEGGNLEICQPNVTPASIPIPPPTYLNSGTSSLPYAFQRPAVRQAREGESVYCYCRCPYDEVSEMIACDAEGCPIEWFHFECVGIMVPPKGKWYCPECRKNHSFSGYR